MESQADFQTKIQANFLLLNWVPGAAGVAVREADALEVREEPDEVEGGKRTEEEGAADLRRISRAQAGWATDKVGFI